MKRLPIEETEAKMGTVFEGRFHDPDTLKDTFAATGFGKVAVIDGDGPATFHAVK